MQGIEKQIALRMKSREREREREKERERERERKRESGWIGDGKQAKLHRIQSQLSVHREKSGDCILLSGYGVKHLSSKCSSDACYHKRPLDKMNKKWRKEMKGKALNVAFLCSRYQFASFNLHSR